MAKAEPRSPVAQEHGARSPQLSGLARPQVDLPHKTLQEASSKQKFEDALSLIHSAWQRSDSLCRGRASRDPWC